MRIALLNIINENKKGAMNKDLAGGMGTYSDIGNSLATRLISFVKKNTIKLPIISFAYLQAILKNSHEIKYIEGDYIDEEYDVVLIYGSIVDYQNEIAISKLIKNNYPKTIVGFFGTFPSIIPEIFMDGADFVIKGEAESFFLYEFSSFSSIKELKGIIHVGRTLDLDDLPTPNFDNFPINNYSYFPAIKEKPFLVLLASKGCPYTCNYYCPYGMIQGQEYRIRSPEKIVEDISYLIKNYHIKGLQFRDPVFGLDKKQVRKFCDLLISSNIRIKFGIETRMDLLDKDILDLMFKAGLRNLNVGIETVNEQIAKKNKRKLSSRTDEKILEYCKKLGIKVSAFYLIGLIDDTEESVKNTINYAIKLNTNIAQFVISCPYPGTKYYDELKAKGMIIEDDFQKFNSMNLVFKHDLTEDQILKLKEYAFKKYYFRLGYLIEFLKWRVREFWL